MANALVILDQNTDTEITVAEENRTQLENFTRRLKALYSSFNAGGEGSLEAAIAIQKSAPIEDYWYMISLGLIRSINQTVQTGVGERFVPNEYSSTLRETNFGSRRTTRGAVG